MSQNIGKIIQIIGPVVDVSFETEGSELPNILDALEIKADNGKTIIIECQQHIGENTVRTISMDSTDGLRRGMTVHATGSAIKMPIGEQINGRLLNVTGQALEIIAITMGTYLVISIIVSLVLNWFNNKMKIKER